MPRRIPATRSKLSNSGKPKSPSSTAPRSTGKYAIMHGQKFTPEEDAAWQQVVALAEHFKSADKIVISLPMWNFGIPYKLKHYIDVLVQPGLAFSFSPETGYKGLITGKPLVAIYARGGAYGPGSGAEGYDAQSSLPEADPRLHRLHRHPGSLRRADAAEGGRAGQRQGQGEGSGGGVLTHPATDTVSYRSFRRNLLDAAMSSVNRQPSNPATQQPSNPATQQPSNPATQHHYRYLDGLRAYLALYVLANHSFDIATKNHSLTAWHIPSILVSQGRFAVCYFIVLSGFCLALPTLKTGLHFSAGTADFFKRRAIRILPTYYFALLLSLILVATILGKKTETNWNMAIPVTPHDVVTHLLLIHNFFTADFFKINYSLWTIAVEWQIYFLFPLLLTASRYFGAMISVVAAAAFSLCVEQAYCSLREQYSPRPFFRHLRLWLPCGKNQASPTEAKPWRSEGIFGGPWRQFF